MNRAEPKWFVLRLWKTNSTEKDDPFHTLTNGNDPSGRFSRRQADEWADYFRAQGFGVVLQACRNQA